MTEEVKNEEVKETAEETKEVVSEEKKEEKAAPSGKFKDLIERIESRLLARGIGIVAVLVRGSSGSTLVAKLIVFPSPGLVDQCLIGIQSLPEAFGRARVARVQIRMPPQSKRPEGSLDFFLTRSEGNP